MEFRYKSNGYRFLLSLLVAIFSFLLCFMAFNHYCDFNYGHQLENEYTAEKVLRNKIMKNDTIQAGDLDSLFSTWHSIMRNERQQIKLEQKTAEQNLTIWLAVIAAICTILPIVIGLNQSINIDRQLEKQGDDFSAQITRASNDLDSKISGKGAELEQLSNDIKKTKDELKKAQLKSFVSQLSVNIKIISELEDLEIHENVSLTCPGLLKCQLEKIKKCTQNSLNIYASLSSPEATDDKNITDYVRRNVMSSSLDYWVMLNGLLKKFEVKFSGKALYDAHDLMDEIWNKVEDLLENKAAQTEDKIENEDVMKELTAMNLYAKKVSDLFVGAFCRDE